MKLFLDTTTPICKIRLDQHSYEFNLGNTLAEQLLPTLQQLLDQHQKTWRNLTELHFNIGPGSYTGLRIGASVINSLAHGLNLPLFDQHGNPHPVIIPLYQPHP